MRVDQPPSSLNVFGSEEPGGFLRQVRPSPEFAHQLVYRLCVTGEERKGSCFPHSIGSKRRFRTPTAKFGIDKHVLLGIVFPGFGDAHTVARGD